MTHAGVTVATVLRDLAETRGIDLELVAGAGGVDRRITNPHPQKTGLALSGFDQYLREGRVLVFGHAIPCLVVTAGFAPPAELCLEADLASLPLMRARAATPLVMARLSA